MAKNVISSGHAASLIAKLIAEAIPVTGILVSGKALAKLRGTVVADDTGLKVVGPSGKLQIPFGSPAEDFEFSFEEKDSLFEETRELGDTALTISFAPDSWLTLVFTY
jgi:hypothetical protein